MSTLSVLTVSLNSEFKLLKTFSSLSHALIANPYSIEWIIVDGCSKDISSQILLFISTLKLANVRIYQESDNGIYDAMNKAVSLASKDFVIFINSGDSIVSSVLQNFLRLSHDYGAIYVFGYLIRSKNLDFVCYPSFFRIYFQFLLSLLGFNLPSSHNSMIYPRHLVHSTKFNLINHCAADYEQYCFLMHLNCRCVYKFTQPISIIDSDGYIASKILTSYRQYLLIAASRSSLLAILYWRLRIFIYLLIK